MGAEAVSGEVGRAERPDLLTRLMHVGLAVGMAVQMFTTLGMEHPKPGRAANELFLVHENLGVVLLGLLVAYWLWAVARTAVGGQPMMLFPWLSRRRLGALAADAAETFGLLLRGRLPEHDGPRPLPAAVQGLGLLIGLGLAGSGTVMFLFAEPGVRMTGWLHSVEEVHEAMGPLMWAYLAVHPLLGVLHQLLGHASLQRMFSFGR